MASRLLLVLASLLMGLGAYTHAAAFTKARAALATTPMPLIFAGSFKALWLADSTTMASLTLIFALIAARPNLASRPLTALLALIPAAIGALIYTFVGNFFAGHMLMATAAAVLLAAAMLP
jgi:uncharacterized membrane protein